MSEAKPTVLITGAGSGIGEATAYLFAQHHHKVVLVGRHREKLDRVASKLKTQSLVLAVDIRRDQEVHWMANEAFKEIGPIGIVVNNAGTYIRKPFLETSDEEWQAQWETNVMGAVRVTRHMAPLMSSKNGGGRIINVTSTVGLRPPPGVAAYAAAKSAMINVTESLALELAPLKITVNAVAFGVVDTPIHGEMSKELRTQMDKLHPLGRMGTPEEAAWGIYQFAHPLSSWTTGATLAVDGGINLT